MTLNSNFKGARNMISLLLALAVFCWSALPVLALSAPPAEEQEVIQIAKTSKEDSQEQAVDVTEDTEAKMSRPSLPPVTDEVYLLARLIHAESRGEPFSGKVAVGAVIINRLHDPRFPDSIWEIIFKRGEFCTVRDDQVNLTPNDESIRAARYAMAGWDPTGGAVYFYNPRTATSSWIRTRTTIAQIGNHVFAV